jgi:hypothetical protein
MAAGTNNLEQFRQTTLRIVDEQLLAARHTLRLIVIQAWQNVLDFSPVSDPKHPGSGRYIASNRISKGTPIDDKGEPLGQGPYATPDLSEAQVIASETNLGDSVWYTNNMGKGEIVGKENHSIAFFIEYGKKRGAKYIYEKASDKTEEDLKDLINIFNEQTIS